MLLSAGFFVILKSLGRIFTELSGGVFLYLNRMEQVMSSGRLIFCYYILRIDKHSE